MTKPKKNNRLSIYLTDDVIAELESESKRLDRKMSWLLRRAWALSKEQILAMPDSPSVKGDNDPN